MTALLDLREVSVTYRVADRASLVDVSLHVEPGEVVLVAGPSGCGKSTLLRVINGLVPRSYRAEVTGEYSVDGEDAHTLPIRSISETVGTLLQDPAKQVVGHSVLAEIAFGLENRGVAPAEIRRRAEAVAARLGLTDLLSRAPQELSGGQLQLVAFAGVLVLEPRVVVVDEPLANLDPDASDVLLSALRAYVDGGGAAVIVEHRVDEVLAIEPDRVLYLEQGRTIYSGDVAGFLKIADPSSVKLPFEALVESPFLAEPALIERTSEDPPNGDELFSGVVETLETEPADPAAGPVTARIAYEGADLGYSDRTVLTAIDHRFHAGEQVAVLGRNGVGKSTLLRAAVGLIEPRRGVVLLEGDPVASLTAKQLVGICGYLFQNPAQALFSSTVRAELAFGPRNLGADEAEIEARSIAALQAVALDAEPGILDRPPRTLSHGQQRRLAVALALTLDPRTLILDEPTAGQDERSAQHFLDAVQAIPTIDSVYFITHDIDLALARADRIVVIDEGGVAASTTPGELVNDLDLWHTPGAVGGVLRETDFVRAVRRHGPTGGRVPSPIELARRLRDARRRTSSTA